MGRAAGPPTRCSDKNGRATLHLGGSKSLATKYGAGCHSTRKGYGRLQRCAGADPARGGRGFDRSPAASGLYGIVIETAPAGEVFRTRSGGVEKGEEFSTQPRKPGEFPAQGEANGT